MTTHDLVTARIDLLDAITDTSHLLRVSKLHRNAGHDDTANEYVHKALSRLERAHAEHTGPWAEPQAPEHEEREEA